MEATQNKNDVTNRFGDRDFILAVFTCFVRKCGRFEVIAIVVPSNVAEFHFRSIGASQNESDVTNRFGDRDFILAVCTRSLCNSDRFEVIGDFRLRSIEASKNGSEVTIQFLVGDLVIDFAEIFRLSSTIQNFFKSFMLVQWLKFFQFWGANMTSKKFFAYLETSKGTTLRKSTSIEAL
jgi:hypothetical protein